MTCGKAFIYTANSKLLRDDPCGTPKRVAFIEDDNVLSFCTRDTN